MKWLHYINITVNVFSSERNAFFKFLCTFGKIWLIFITYGRGIDNDVKH